MEGRLRGAMHPPDAGCPPLRPPQKVEEEEEDGDFVRAQPRLARAELHSRAPALHDAHATLALSVCPAGHVAVRLNAAAGAVEVARRESRVVVKGGPVGGCSGSHTPPASEQRSSRHSSVCRYAPQTVSSCLVRGGGEEACCVHNQAPSGQDSFFACRFRAWLSGEQAVLMRVRKTALLVYPRPEIPRWGRWGYFFLDRYSDRQTRGHQTGSKLRTLDCRRAALAARG